MYSRQLFTLTALTVTLSAAPAFAQQPRDFSAKSARVTRAPNGGALTGPSSASRPAIVIAFLASLHSQRTVQGVFLQKENAANTGITHLTFGQRVAGLDVYGTYVKAALNQRGEIISVIENLEEAPPALVPEVETHRGALESVLAEYYPGTTDNLQELRASGETVEFSRGARFTEDPKVTRVAVPMASGAMQTGYLVITWDNDNILRHTVVGAGGRILVEELRTNTDSYRVFTNSPLVTPQVVVAGPGAGNLQSPSGWVSGTTTTGNNVDAYLDRDNNNAPDATNARPVSATQDFVFTFDLTAAPTTTANQNAAVTNLFYLNNVIHDELYKHGFNEAAGNFQTNNFGKGGAGNDPVNAEAQDGGGTSNANFSTPTDGSRPRMQMYLWNQSTPNRDGDVDSDVIFHEYGHGLTWRMIGGMSGALAGAIGEGMSDTLAIYLNNDDVVGEYSYNNSTGIRRNPYTNYPRTYGDVTGSSVHNDGEVYAATMWRLRQLWLDSGRTQDALLDRIVDAMNFTPSTPDYEAMRDGILAAMSTDEDCLAWQAFAQFGIGVGANGTAGSCIPFFGCSVTITESFAVPLACSTGGGGGNTAPTVTITSPSTGATLTAGATATFIGSAMDTQDGTISAGLTWTSSINGNLGTGASVSTTTLSLGTHTITASSTDSGNLTTTASITVTVNPAAPPPTINITITTRKVKGVNYADLIWSGTDNAVNVTRNGSTVSTNNSSGKYSDNTGTKGGGISFTYQVCEAANPTVCSAMKTVVF